MIYKALFFFNQNTRNSKIYIFLPEVKERPFKRARDGAYVLLNCPIKAEIRAVDIANQI